jgi:hypothetical protein
VAPRRALRDAQKPPIAWVFARNPVRRLKWPALLLLGYALTWAMFAIGAVAG